LLQREIWNIKLSDISQLHEFKIVVKCAIERYEPDFTAKFLLMVQEVTSSRC
jgi:hypothetical protein